MLRGREHEQGALRALVDRARRGDGSALLVRGEPGIGKSALLDDVTTVAEDLTVLRTRGVESEAPLPFAALHRLLRPVASHLDAVPPPQAAALRAAFGETTDRTVERHLVFLGTLNLLSEVAGPGDGQDARGVAVVVDDAHWLDDASAAALLFVSRRLEGEPIALVFAVRDDERGAFDSVDIPELHLTGVDEAAARALIADHTTAPVTDHVRADLLEVTRGNPLGLLELTGALSADQLSGHAPLPDRLPLTEGLERAFLDRYRRLPASAQTLLLVAAADDSGRSATITRAVTALGADPGALEAAEGSGLLADRDGTLTLRHPLVRSAIYGAATSTRRREVHRALAAALAGTPQEDRRAWHLAASVDGPDEQVVAALDEAAARAHRRGGHEAASAAWARAAELTVDPHARARRLAAAAESSLAAGRPADTERFTRAALVDAIDPLLRVDLLRLQGQVEWNHRSLDHGYRTVCRAAATAAPHDRERARLLAMLAASLAAFGATSVDAPDPSGIVPPPSPDASPVQHVAADLLEGFAAVARADWTTAATALRRAWEQPIPPDAPPVLHHNLAIATMHLADDARAIALHDLQLLHARDAGAVNMVEHALTRGTVFRIATGDWTGAVSAAQEAVVMDENLGRDDVIAFPLAELAVVAALRGEPQAPSHLERLEAALTTRPPRGVTAGLITGLAHWARARQADVAAATALHHLEQVRLPVLRGLSALDRVETAVHAGAPERADSWVTELHELATGTDLPWAWAAYHHCRAVVGAATGAPDVEDEFAAALGWHTRSPRRPDQARTQLALGEHLRRHRRRTDARVPLREALETFESLGAAPWAERARQELRASGETARRGANRVASKLTAQESQVAGLVRQGLSNKDVAARLFVSPRTVDFHLRNVFTKLGITSRTELAALPTDSL